MSIVKLEWNRKYLLIDYKDKIREFLVRRETKTCYNLFDRSTQVRPFWIKKENIVNDNDELNVDTLFVFEVLGKAY